MTSLTQVQALADAYRNAMREGDQQLSDSRLERLFLHALVASSAADTARWVKTRLPDGAAAPLESLVPALQKGDTIGKGLDAAKKQITDQVKATVNTAVFGATMPVWLGAVGGILVGLFGLTFDAGAATGQALLALVAGGGPVVYAAFRTISVAGPKAVEAVGGAAGSLWSWVSGLGDRAERLYQPAVRPALQSVYGGTPQSSGPTVTQQVSIAAPTFLWRTVVREDCGARAEFTVQSVQSVANLRVRGSAKTVVRLTYALLAFASLVFIAGMFNAFDAAASAPPPICDIFPTDPSC